MSLTIQPYMIKNPVTVIDNESLQTVINKMEHHNVSHILVKDDSDNLVGIISKSDLLIKLNNILSHTAGKTYSYIQMQSVKASDIMTKDPVSLEPDSSMNYAVELLLQKQFHCLPVVSEGKPVGIISFYDLLKAYHDQY